MTLPVSDSIVVDGQQYQLSNLTEFGFDAPLQLAGAQRKGSGTLVIGDQQIEIEFRVRRSVRGVSSCTFIDFPLVAKEKVRKHLRSRKSGGGGLSERSYDELASGIIDDTSAATVASATDTSSDAGQQKRYVKSFAMMALLLTMLGLVVMAAVFLRSRSTLSVANAALVGNCLPVNSKVEGEILEVLVGVGDEVRKGDVLVRLTNPEIQNESKMLTAQLATAESKVKSLEKQKLIFLSKLKFASKKLDLDHEVAVKELQAARQSRSGAQAAYTRMVPFQRHGSVTQIELDEVANLFRAEDSNCIAKESLLKKIEFAQEAASENVLIIGDRVDDALGKIQADLEFAQAEATELRKLRELTFKRMQDLNVVAPRDGQVYVAYRQRGEFIKIADELVALSYPGETWASGQVSAGQASRVLPGQPVTIRVPALKKNLEGIVMAVGHRAMYSRGHYNAEFRGATATDVPVKVFIEDLPEDIPSGIRLDMAINTGFGVEWLDDSMGYEIRPIGRSRSKQNDLHDDSKDDHHSEVVKLAAFPETGER